MQVFLITWLCFNLGSSLKFKNTVSYPRSYFLMYSINISCQKQNIFACRKLNPSLSDPKGYSGPLFSPLTQFPFLSPSLNDFACQQSQQLGRNCRLPPHAYSASNSILYSPASRVRSLPMPSIRSALIFHAYRIFCTLCEEVLL